MSFDRLGGCATVAVERAEIGPLCVVETSEDNVSLFKPLAEIANRNDLLPDRVIGVTWLLLATA
jgi:hypothetical protein